jgi:4-hydroxy-tetrahydrodipicolinate synthase
MFRGSIVALVTPMAANGSLDGQALAELVEFHVASGTDAIVVVGTTGESATLSEEEHCQVIADVVGFAAGRIPVIAGTGANSTSEALRLTRCAKEVGADACLLVTPYYNKPTQEGLFLHHKFIAESVDIPQILYNVPGRTAVDMRPETVARLAEIPNIVGIKDATGDLERYQETRALCGNEFAIFSGDDETAMELMLAGADGDISVTANVAPKQMHEMCIAAMAGDRATATAINDTLMVLHKGLFVESNPIPVKWALYEMGRIPEGIRLPLTALSEIYRRELSENLHAAGLL